MLLPIEPRTYGHQERNPPQHLAKMRGRESRTLMLGAVRFGTSSCWPWDTEKQEPQEMSSSSGGSRHKVL